MKKAIMVSAIALGTLVSTLLAIPTSSHQPIKNIRIIPVPNPSSEPTEVTVDGPGPIVSLQYRYSYELISSVKCEYIDKNIDSYTNTGTSDIKNLGGTSYTLPADKVDIASNIIGGGAKYKKCREAIESLIPYSVMRASISEVSPRVVVGAGTRYEYDIVDAKVTYTISESVQKRTWSWGSWHKWSQYQVASTTSVTIDFYSGCSYVYSL